MKERDGLLGDQYEHQTLVSLSIWLTENKSSILAQNNNWEGAEGEGAIAE